MWIVTARQDDTPTAFHTYDRSTGEIQFLFSDRPELSSYTLAHMEPLVIKTRDGLSMASYLSLPPAQVPLLLRAAQASLLLVKHSGFGHHAQGLCIVYAERSCLMSPHS